MTDPWAEKPEPLPVGWAETLYYSKPDLDAFHQKLQASIDESMADCHHSLEIVTRKLTECRKKADLWDQYAIYDNDKEEEILVKDLITVYEKLKAIKKIWVEYRGCSEDCEACDTVDWCLFLEHRKILGAEE